MRARSGTTLVELLVTMVLIGIITSVVTLAIRRIDQPSPSDPATMLADSLTTAIRDSRDIVLSATLGGRVIIATARADGSVVADTSFHFDRLTGRPANAR